MSYLSQKIRKVIEDDREALCEMMTDEEVKEAIMNAPMPDLSSFDVENKTEKTEKNEKNEKTEKKKKEKSDKPRRVSGYLTFCQEFRKTADGKSSAIVKMAGEKWSSMSDEEKSVWNGKANEATKSIMEEYMKTHPDYVQVKTIKKSASTIPRAKSPIQFFVVKLATTRTEKGKELTKVANQLWETMTDDDKAEFVKQSNESKEIAIQFRTFSASIKEQLIAEGVEDTKKALNDAAAEKWKETH